MSDYTLIKGDARTATKDLPPNSVHLVFTSPPYYNIKEYTDNPKEIGTGENLGSYYSSVRTVFQECYRLLHPGCYMVINIGDQFMPATDKKPFHILPLSANLLELARRQGNDSTKWMEYIGTVRWKKVSTTKNSGGGSIMGSVDLPRDAHFLKNYEDIHFLRKAGTAPKPTSEQKEKSRFTMTERKIWVRSTWDDIPPARKSIGHQAPFPIALAERVIRLRSYYGETVYDPFVGSGSTLAAAFKTGRKSIGCELGWTSDDSWVNIIKDRIASVNKPLTDVLEGL